MIRLPLFVVVCLCTFAAAAPSAATAQTSDTAAARRFIEQQVGHPVSQEEILTRIQESGLTRAQAQSRLRQLGYDPGLLDPYYDAIEAGAGRSQSAAAAAFARELQALERAPRRPEGADTILPEPPAVRATVASSAEALPRFGRELFSRSTTEFQPIQYGPVDEGYRIGPGDEILLVLTGGVESAYSLEVNRQGYIIVPDVGQVPVTGKTMVELEQTLRQYLGRVYAGIRGADPTIHFHASLGRLRTNQVFIVGEVEVPGAYQVGAFATVFNALYQAGGPNEMGTFRRVQVRRGDDVVRTIDLYDYLLYGDSRADVRLDNGDRIHVPLADKNVTVRGAVRRPAIYELLPDEGLTDVLGYAGGFMADAVVRRVQVDRILPPDRRRPGADRVLVDVDLAALAAGEGEFALEDGDVVHVFSISGERRHRVMITGDVNRPGRYEWMPGSTLADLVARAEGLEEAAYTPRIHIYRLNEERGDRRLISVAADAALEDGEAAVVLADMDSVVVYSRAALRTPELVYISGFVKNPGTYPLAEGMTIEDLVLAAGGFRAGAHMADAEVARVPANRARTDTTAVVLRVGLAVTDGGPASEWEVPVWRPGASEFELRRDDRVFIRKAPGYDDARTVTVTGEVAFPGQYVLARRRERLTDLLERAGGFTSEVHVPGIRVVREGRLVAVDAEEALSDPDSPLNIALEAGDSLQIPQYDPTVLVLGAVNFESRVLYEPGRSLNYYIERAGGYRDVADRDHVSVTRQNGERNTVQRFLMMQSAPAVTPGSTVFVPTVPPTQRSLFTIDSLLTRVVSIASVTATLLIAISQLN